MAYVVQQIVKTTAGWAEFDALGKPMPKNYWLFEQVTETSEDVTKKYYKFKISDGVNLYADLPYQLLNGHSASINEAGNWLVYDDATQTYKDSGAKAIGVDGKSAFELWQALEGNADKTLDDYFAAQKGDKGDPFKYTDFTEEQLESLKVKGDKGDAFMYSDFTTDQIDGLKLKFAALTDEDKAELKGVKGDPFIFEDFTEEQLSGLKGKDGQSAYLDAVAKGYAGTKDEFDTLLAGISKGAGSIVIPSAFTSLILANKSDLSIVTSEEILASIGGENGFNAVYDGVTNKSSVLMAYLLDGVDILCPVLSMTAINQEGVKLVYLFVEFNTPGEQDIDYQSMFVVIDGSGGTYALGGIVRSAPYTSYIDINELAEYGGQIMPDDVYNKLEEAYMNHVTVGKFTYMSTAWVPVYITDNISFYTVLVGQVGFDSPTTTNSSLGLIRITVNKTTKETTSDIGGLTFMQNGDGTKALMDNGTYKPVISPTDIATLTSLSSLSPTKYSQKYTYTSTTAQGINFASTPEEGFECMLDIKNDTSSQITQAIPNAAAWQCEETSLVIPAGKVGSISIRYVHGKYCVRVGL